MLSKAAAAFRKNVEMRQPLSLIKNNLRAFSHGPYNPLHYKTHLVPEELPS